MNFPTYTRKNAPRELLVHSEWEEVDTSNFEKLEMVRIARLIEALRLYIDGAPVNTCLDGRCLNRSQLLRAFRRCIARDHSGRQFGWRGLVKYVRVREAKRTKPLIACGRAGGSGLTGALKLVLRQYDHIREEIDSYILGCAKRIDGHEARARPKSVHQKFLELCREAGLEAAMAWPFNTVKQGKGAIRAYVEGILRDRYDQIVETQYGAKAKAKSMTGRGFASRLLAPRPLDVVELDEHRCHFMGSIGVPTPGGVLWVPGERVTIILAVERTFGTILAYKAVFTREADSDDVLDVLAQICGMPRDRLFDAEMQPSTKAAFPTDLGGPFNRCGFNQLLVDNALIHLAEPVLTRARDIIGCDINYGPVKRFERRSTNEGAFGALERHGFHRLPTTTGTNPSDPRRQDPAKTACQLKLSVPQTLDIIEAVAADYNGVISKGGYGTSRLNRLKAWAEDVDGFGMIFPELPHLPDGVADLNTTVVPVTIRGNKATGRRPYVHFEEEEYFGKELADRWDLIGQGAFAHVCRGDIRELVLFLKSGIRVDTLTVRGRWARAPIHSRDVRRLINRAIRNGQLRVEYDEDPVHRFMDKLRKGLESSTQIDRDKRKALSLVAEGQKDERQRAASAPNGVLNAAPYTSHHLPEALTVEDELLPLDDLFTAEALRT